MNSRTLNTNITRIKFQNSMVVYETFMKCTIKDYEFNLSYNPSLLSGSQAALVPYSSSINGSVFYNPTGSEYFGILKDFTTGSISGSDFSPYVTTIGLYNDSQDLLAIAKMSSPMPVSDNTDMTFLVKWDTQWIEKTFFIPSPTSTPSTSVPASIPATPSVTPSISISSSPAGSPSISKSPSITPSITPSVTPSISQGTSISVTPSITVTPSVTPSITVTPSRTPSITPSTSPPCPTPREYYISVSGNFYWKDCNGNDLYTYQEAGDYICICNTTNLPVSLNGGAGYLTGGGCDCPSTYDVTLYGIKYDGAIGTKIFYEINSSVSPPITFTNSVTLSSSSCIALFTIQVPVNYYIHFTCVDPSNPGNYYTMGMRGFTLGTSTTCPNDVNGSCSPTTGPITGNGTIGIAAITDNELC